jgi:2-phospho-L-lactate transferase/gluconeogenesis factor (CofD/UPF0052 family)
MTKLGETAGYGASAFASEVVRYIGGRKIDHFLVNNGELSPEVLGVYAAEDASPVVLDNGNIGKYAHQITVSDLASINGLTVRHDSVRLAEIVMATIE